MSAEVLLNEVERSEIPAEAGRNPRLAGKTVKNASPSPPYGWLRHGVRHRFSGAPPCGKSLTLRTFTF